MKNRKVLLYTADDSGQKLNQLLESHNWQVNIAGSFSSAQELLQKDSYNVAIVLLNGAFGADFLQHLESLLSCDASVNWFLILPDDFQGDDNVPEKVNALIGEYCFDYHHSPVQDELFLTILGHAYGMAAITRNPRYFAIESHSKFGIIGHSLPIKTLHNQISKVSKQNDPVLIIGETGTGKELVANAIHYHSSRAKAKIIAVNCGSLTESLVQAELFGYEKGAFTGAHKRKIGRIEAAQGGTLFLDEVGDLPLSQQTNLLRFLEQKTIVRVGGEEEVPIDVRIIAATHINLEKAVAEGHFREDLYFRLKVLCLNVPPLRERGEDVELLARYFLKTNIHLNRNKAKGLSLGALHVIRNYAWPGNVRELANSIKCASIMSENRLISPADLELEQRRNNRPLFQTLEQNRADADRSAIQGCLRQCNYNITRASELLGISRVTLHRLMDKYQLKS